MHVRAIAAGARLVDAAAALVGFLGWAAAAGLRREGFAGAGIDDGCALDGVESHVCEVTAGGGATVEDGLVWARGREGVSRAARATAVC